MKFGDGRQHDGDIATIGFRDATYRDLALISALRGRNVLIPSLSRRASVHCFRLVGPATMASLSSTHQCCRGGLASTVWQATFISMLSNTGAFLWRKLQLPYGKCIGHVQKPNKCSQV